jgi:hypothetical protein
VANIPRSTHAVLQKMQRVNGVHTIHALVAELIQCATADFRLHAIEAPPLDKNVMLLGPRDSRDVTDHRKKLSTSDREKIIALWKKGARIVDLSSRFGVSAKTIREVTRAARQSADDALD